MAYPHREVRSQNVSPGDGVSDFEIANRISDLLKEVAKDRQQRIVRWVAESIELPLSPALGSSPGADLAPTGQVPGRAMDIKSFVDSKSPKSDNQFATVVAYYYRFDAPVDQRRDTISAEILQDAARLSGRPRLAKPLMTLNNAKKQGYLDAVDRGQFRVNSVGENLVAMALPGADTATTSGRTRRSRIRPKKRARKQTTSKRSARGSKQKGARTARR